MIVEKAGQGTTAQAAQAYPPTTVPELSRRSFLKLLGLGALPIATGLPLFKLAVWPDQEQADHMQFHLAEQARALLLPAIAELQTQGFPFDSDQSILVELPQQPHLLGLMLRDTRLPPRHDGADIAMTIDLHAPERSTLTYLVGRSHADGLELRQVIVEGDGRRQERQIHLSRDAGEVQQRSPVHAAHRMLYQAASPMAAGHGEDSPLWHEQTQWYYNHAGGALWLDAAGSEGAADQLLRFTTCEEYRNNRIRSAPQAHRSQRRYGETRTVSLEQASLPAFVCTVERA
jgi:hypothetical protein